jgi:hypothetical protein
MNAQSPRQNRTQSVVFEVVVVVGRRLFGSLAESAEEVEDESSSAQLGSSGPESQSRSAEISHAAHDGQNGQLEAG